MRSRDPPSLAVALARSGVLRAGDVARFVRARRRRWACSITGSDTRTPAHYHAVITAVSVSSAGHAAHLRTRGAGPPAGAPRGRRASLIGLYGGGQFVASIGMFVAGGYGAARKTPDRRRLARRGRGGRHGRAWHRLHLHHHRRRGFRRRRDQGAIPARRDWRGPLSPGLMAARISRTGSAGIGSQSPERRALYLVKGGQGAT